jgi:hypothetical protein
MNHSRGECATCGVGLSCAWLELEQSQANPQGLSAAEESLLTPVALPGFIADFLYGSSELFAGFSVWRCPGEEACPGGTGNARGGECAAGREGIACGRCITGYREVSQFGECEKCPNEGAVRSIVTVVGMFIALLCALLYLVTCAAKEMAKGASVKDTKEKVQGFRAASKTLFRYSVQLSIVSDFDIRWPPLNRWLFAWPKILRLDVFHIIDVRCLFNKTLTRTMCVYWMMPVGAAALTFFAATLNNKLSSVRLSKRFIPLSRHGVLEILGALYSIFIGSIVKQCLLPFECVKHPNGRYTLAAMPDVECSFGEQAVIWPIGTFFLSVYVLFYFGFVMYVSKKVPQWTQKTKTAKQFQFVHADFRSGCFWWGPVVLTRDLLSAYGCALPWRWRKPDRLHDVRGCDVHVSHCIFSPIPGLPEQQLGPAYPRWPRDRDRVLAALQH